MDKSFVVIVVFFSIFVIQALHRVDFCNNIAKAL